MVKGALFKQWINNWYNYCQGRREHCLNNGSTTGIIMVKGALFKQWINNGCNYGKGSTV